MIPDPYPYQAEAYTRIQKACDTGHNPVLVAPTGSGKTMMGLYSVREDIKKKLCVLWLVHKQELLRQAQTTFGKAQAPFGVISSKQSYGFFEKIQIASIPTLHRRLDTLQVKPDRIYVDEAHHVASATWKKIVQFFPNARIIGLTATPCRSDGKPLSKYFTIIIQTVGMRELIEMGFSPNYEYHEGKVDISQFRTQAEADHQADEKVMIGSVYDKYREIVKANEQVLIFAPSVQKSMEFVKNFKNQGIRALHLDCNTPFDDRNRGIEAYKRGEYQVMSNQQLFTEGTDLPMIKHLFLCRFTKSLGLLFQMWGRGFRTYPGKGKLIITDFVRNASKNDMLPDDEIKWTLDSGLPEGKPRNPMRECMVCGGPSRRGPKVCPYCGNPFPIGGSRPEMKQVDGTFVQKASFYDRLLAHHDMGREAFYKFFMENKCKGNPAAKFDEITNSKLERNYYG